MGFDIGGPQYGLRDGKMGIWDGDGTYSSIIDIYGIRILSAKTTTENTDLEGDDVVLATATRTKKAEVTLAFASTQLAVLELLTGVPQESTGTGSGQKMRQRITSKNPRYIGIAGQAMAEEGNGDTHLFIPKAKIASGFEVRFELNAFSIPELTLTAVADSNFLDDDDYPMFFEIVEHATAVALALPPVFS